MAAKIDVHIHLVGSGCCDSGCFVSKDFKRRYTFRLIKLLMGISDLEIKTDIDIKWVDQISAGLFESEIDYGVALGFDAVIKNGEIDYTDTQMMIPNEWVFKVANDNKNILPGPSVNPYRKDALEILEKCNEQKAVLIKWLPSTQRIDPADTKLRPFYNQIADLNLPLLVHIGGERTFKSLSPEFNFLKRLEMALELGVKVICAHSATPILASREPNQLKDLEVYLNRYPHLWVDNSGMCNPGRFHHTGALANHELISQRTLYGSDWPVPSNALYFVSKLGIKKTWQIDRMKNYFQRDIETKRSLGYPDTSLTRANSVLANLDAWVDL